MSELIDRQAFIENERKLYCEDCDRRKGTKNGKPNVICYEIGEAPCRACWLDDALDDLEDFPAASPWHRVEERLPPMLYQAEGDDFCIDYSLIVLAYREASHDFYLARQMDDGHGATWGTDCFDELYGVTHWMPMPEPPKEDA